MNRLNFRSQLNSSITKFIKGISKTNKISIIISFLILLVLTIQSCKKTKEDLRVISDPIESARIALADASKEQHTNIDTSMYRQSLRRTILWEKALLRKIGDSTIVYAPVRLSKELTIKEGGKPGVSVNDISWLVATKFKEKYKFDMVLRIPAEEKGTTGKFNGVLIVDDWFGKKQTFYIDKNKQKDDASKVKDANGDVITTMGSSCKTTGYTICAGDHNHCYTTYETTCTYTSEPPIEDSPYDPYGGGDPGGQVPGSGGGGENNPSNDIKDEIKDPCIKKGLDMAKNRNITGEIAGIIKDLDKETFVKITVTDGVIAPGKYGQTVGTFDRTNNIFSATITLSSELLPNSSQEYVTGVVIHEVLHAYFRQTTSTDEKLDGMDHNEMSQKYINPMASFLERAFGIGNEDALAIAWRGVNDTDAYKNSQVFSTASGSISKEELERKGAAQSIGLEGTKCN